MHVSGRAMFAVYSALQCLACHDMLGVQDTGNMGTPC